MKAEHIGCALGTARRGCQFVYIQEADDIEGLRRRSSQRRNSRSVCLLSPQEKAIGLKELKRNLAEKLFICSRKRYYSVRLYFLLNKSLIVVMNEKKKEKKNALVSMPGFT